MMIIYCFVTAILVIVYSYIVYPLLLLIITRFKPENTTRTAIENDNLPKVSLIIAAYNEEKVIEEKISNSTSIDYPRDRIEILIGSDGSEDRTDEICNKFSDDIAFIRVEPRQGKSNMLNTLVQKASGEILVFSDANTIFDSLALKKIVSNFVDESIGGVCGKLVLKGEGEGVEACEKGYWEYESLLKSLESRYYSTLSSNGGIYAIRKGLYKPIPKDTIIDDFLVSLNVLEQGYRIVFAEGARAYEDISTSISDEFWRKVRIGSGNLQAFLRKPLIISNKAIYLFFSYYSHKVIRWTIPFALLIMYACVLVFAFLNSYFWLLHLTHLIVVLVLLGVALEVKNTLVNLICYFFLFNMALLVGYIKYITGSQKVTWRKAAR